MDYDVVIATYNGERFIVKQLESIFLQTVKPNSIFIRDDCSTDNTVAEIKKLLHGNIILNEINIKIIEGSENLGYIKNFERLSTYCTSEIIFFSDQDDIWVNNKAELILNALQLKGDVNVVFTDAFIVDEREKKIGTLWDYVNFKSDEYPMNFENIVTHNIVTGATMAVRNSYVANLIPFPKFIPHDHWIATNAVIDSCLGSVNRKLIMYRQHAANQIGARKTSLFRKVISLADYSKFHRRLNYYRQIHFLLEALGNNDRTINLATEKENLAIYTSLMNQIFNYNIISTSLVTERHRPFIFAFFSGSYLKYKTPKLLLTDILDSILSRKFCDKK